MLISMRIASHTHTNTLTRAHAQTCLVAQFVSGKKSSWCAGGRYWLRAGTRNPPMAPRLAHACARQYWSQQGSRGLRHGSEKGALWPPSSVFCVRSPACHEGFRAVRHAKNTERGPRPLSLSRHHRCPAVRRRQAGRVQSYMDIAEFLNTRVMASPQRGWVRACGCGRGKPGGGT